MGRPNKTSIQLSGVEIDRANNLVSGWARGRNGWRFEFHISPGLIDLDTRGLTDYAVKADARQIKRELKKTFSAMFEGVR